MNQELENKLKQFGLIKYKEYFLSLYNNYPVYDTYKETHKLHNSIRRQFPNGIPASMIDSDGLIKLRFVPYNN